MYSSISLPEMEQLYRKEKKALSILDVRETDEYVSGHIPEAESIPLSSLPELMPTIDKNTHHYIICHSGSRSARAAKYLSENGYHVTNIMGGMSAWKDDIQ